LFPQYPQKLASFRAGREQLGQRVVIASSPIKLT
jgi:hypothetical protein